MWQSVGEAAVEDAPLESVSFQWGKREFRGGDSQTILYSTDLWRLSGKISQRRVLSGGGFPGRSYAESNDRVCGPDKNSIFQTFGAGYDRWAVPVWETSRIFILIKKRRRLHRRPVSPRCKYGCRSQGFVFWTGEAAIARTTDGGMNWSNTFFDQAIEGVDFPSNEYNKLLVFAVGRGRPKSCTPTNMGIALDRPVQWGPLPISIDVFLRQTTHCEGSQLATVARSYGPQTAGRTGADTNAVQSPPDGDSGELLQSRGAAADTRASPDKP